MSTVDPRELKMIYEKRFEGELEYRNRVWTVLCNRFWNKFVAVDASVLDLGCGYGQFINNIRCAKKFAMDLNPEARRHLNPDVTFLEQDCAVRWELPDESLDVVFTSNFFEHLPCKITLQKTFIQAKRCLKRGGKLIAMGPNIKYLPGRYWDFWDHHLPLSEASLMEGLLLLGMHPEVVVKKFLPYTMVRGPKFPAFLVGLYVQLPILWAVSGKQFLVIAKNP